MQLRKRNINILLIIIFIISINDSETFYWCKQYLFLEEIIIL